MEKFNVDLQPVGRRVSVPVGESLLSAAQAAGIALIAICGGEGLCQECRVRLVSGKLTPLTLVEEASLEPADLENDFRLACQASPLSDVKIEIPPESLTASQRLQVEVALPPPSLADLRDDLSRLREGLALLDHFTLSIGLPVLVQFSELMRIQSWQGRLAMGRDGQVVSVLPSSLPLYGFAVDVGTTKLAAYLVNLEDGTIACRRGAMNPQISYGEAVVASIAYANQGESHRRTLQTRLVETLNGLLADLCAVARVTQGQVVDAVIVGNTAMHNLVAGVSLSLIHI